ncbi:ABC transporter permease [Streptomyces filipinensis]|uniref:ABC transporter permease n=1 Tax=Streptomyces filipinensis TaxID=66887 RepID=UPI0036EFDBDF
MSGISVRGGALARWLGVGVTASRIGFREFASFYTWRTWVFGWFLRLVTQVVFFSAVGSLSGSGERVRYLAVGNASVIVCVEALVVITTTVRERDQGTLALQVAAPADFALTYLFRGAYCLLIGIVSGTLVFALATVFFSLPAPVPRVLCVPFFLGVIGASAYGWGTFIGAWVLRRPGMQWLVLNLSYLSMMAFCGVNVPTGYWPSGITFAAELLPLTHGLRALRALLAGSPASAVLPELGTEVLIGALWLVAGVAALRWAIAGERRRGTIELSA